MLFSYLNLPKIPTELEQLCLTNIDLIDSDSKLNELNKLEGIGHSITYLPPSVKSWLLKNIIIPNFNPVPAEMVSRSVLHVSHYIKHSEGTGVHPAHVDYGRNYALNYVINTGGDKVVTYWTDVNKEHITFETEIEPHRWHVIRVNPDWHGVRGIRVGKLRTIVSICFSPADLETFDDEAYFGKLLTS